MNDFLAAFADKLPQLAMAALAAKTAGPQGVAAFQQGLVDAQRQHEAQQLQQQQQIRQTSEDALRRQNVQSEIAARTATTSRENISTASSLMDKALAGIPETAATPESALEQARTYQGELARQFGIMPSLLPIGAVGEAVSQKIRNQAKTLVRKMEEKWKSQP